MTPTIVTKELDAALEGFTPGVDRAVRYVSIDQVDMLAEFYLHNRRAAMSASMVPVETCVVGSAIIGTATPAQPDKIAEAARKDGGSALSIVIGIAEKALRYEAENPGAHPLNVTKVFRSALQAVAGRE